MSACLDVALVAVDYPPGGDSRVPLGWHQVDTISREQEVKRESGFRGCRGSDQVLQPSRKQPAHQVLHSSQSEFEATEYLMERLDDLLDGRRKG